MVVDATGERRDAFRVGGDPIGIGLDVLGVLGERLGMAVDVGAILGYGGLVLGYALGVRCDVRLGLGDTGLHVAHALVDEVDSAGCLTVGVLEGIERRRHIRIAVGHILRADVLPLEVVVGIGHLGEYLPCRSALRDPALALRGSERTDENPRFGVLDVSRLVEPFDSVLEHLGVVIRLIQAIGGDVELAAP